VASQYYQFAFNFNAPAVATSFQTQGAANWTPYQQPNYTNGQIRTGGPNNPTNPNGPSGNYLVANVGDTVYINLVGPTGWKAGGTVLQVIVSQANSPGSAQGASPFVNNQVFFGGLTGTLQGDGVTMQYTLPSTIQASANPGGGNYNRYELTIAFTAQDASGNSYNFSDDPEMDVQGS
jgi:hypothetical protein